MENKTQVLVNMRTGDKVLFDVENYDEFKKVCSQLYQDCPWIEVGKTSFIRTTEIMSIYYLPEGYAKGSDSNSTKT